MMEFFAKNMSLLDRVSCVPACQRGLCVNKRDNEPYGVPLFQLGVLMCQTFKHYSYEMPRKTFIL